MLSFYFHCKILVERTYSCKEVIALKRKLFLILICVVLLLPCLAQASYYRVNTTWLKAHEKPAYSAKVLDSYRRDFAVSIVHRYSGGWARVRFLPSGNTVYVQSKYLKASSSYTAYIRKDSTLLRAGPATSFKALGKLNAGTKVTVLTHGSAFDYVSTPKGKGYIRNSCLSTAKPNGRTAHIKNPARRTVNLRKGPGKKYAVIAEYRPGTKVTLLKRGSAWCKVKVRGRTGYIMTKYISLD